jgi:hypothetical protein
MLFDLRPVSSTMPRLAPRLEVTPERVSMVRRLPGLPNRSVLSYGRDQVDSVRFYGGTSLIESGLLEFVEERAVDAHMQAGRDLFLVVVFDDNTAWVLEGADHELERARSALLVPTRTLEAVSEPEPGDPDPFKADAVVPWLFRIGVVCGILGAFLLIVGEIRARDDEPSVETVPVGADVELAPAAPSAPGRVVPPPPEPPPGSPLAAGQLPKIAAQLTRELGRRPRVYRILVGERQATFEVYLVGRTDAIEGWVWEAGQLRGPAEIVAPPLPGAQFTFNDVRLSRIHGLVQDAKQRARVGAPDAERANVVVRRDLPGSRGLRIRITVTGPGGERTFVAGPNGRLLAGP